MKSIRLLPLLVFAAIALLVLKGIGLVTEGGYVLTGVQQVSAQATAETTSTDPAAPMADPMAGGALPPDGGGINPAESNSAGRTGLSNSEASAADRASENLFSRAGPAPVSSSQLDAVPFEVNKAGEKVPLVNEDGASATEQAVLERLADRRAELDALENQIKAREAVVAAAEKRLNERIDQLKALEQQINVLVERKKAADQEEFKGLVSMYENMKPKDAASIFNQLGDDVLYRVAIAMNPRKMSPVLAAMNTQRAQQLTAMMAAEQVEPSLDAASNDLSQLPQIVGQ